MRNPAPLISILSIFRDTITIVLCEQGRQETLYYTPKLMAIVDPLLSPGVLPCELPPTVPQSAGDMLNRAASIDAERSAVNTADLAQPPSGAPEAWTERIGHGKRRQKAETAVRLRCFEEVTA
jgi:hypothetical protein